jgi:hypothetical protein
MSFSFKIERSSSSTTTNKRPSTQNNSRQNSNHLNPDSSDEDHHPDEHRNRKKRPVEFISDFDSTRFVFISSQKQIHTPNQHVFLLQNNSGSQRTYTAGQSNR